MAPSSDSRRCDLVWLAGNASALAATAIAAFLDPDHGLFWIYATVLSRVLLYFSAGRRPWGRRYAELLAAGAVAGALELLADYFLVHGIESGRLVYPTRDAVLLASPLYMPLAWACVLTEFGYLILRLGELLRRPALGALLGALLAGLTIGGYEFLAWRAGWWYYEPARHQLGAHCALYIPVAEVLMFLPYAAIHSAGARAGDFWLRALLRGAAYGATIFASYALAWLALESGAS